MTPPSSAPPPGQMPQPRAGLRPISGLELAAVAVLLLAALFPRSRDMGEPFDRHFEGYQGAFFTTAAVNYERLGFDAFGGYPILNIDVTRESDPSTWYVYPNHPPTVPWMTWAGIEWFGPEGWSEAWRSAEPPKGVETFARFPFLLSSLLGALALWWAVRQAGGIQQALLALALYAVLPLPALYGTLINYEKPSLVGVLLAYGFYARWIRYQRRTDLVGAGASFALAGAITYGPAFFVPPLVLHALLRRGLKSAIAIGAATTLGVLLPLSVHAVCVGSALESIGQSSDGLSARIGRLVGPIFDGTLPISQWVGFQLERCVRLFTLPACLAALAGLAYAFRPSRSRAADGPIALGPLLGLGGLLLLLGFYRHTFDDPPQDPFLLNLGPAIAVLGAALLNAVSRPLYRLRGGVAPLVVATSLIALPCVMRLDGLRRDWRAPGPLDVAREQGPVGPDAPLPTTVGREIAELLPPGAVGLHPMELGYNLAVSFYAWRTLFGVTTAESGAGSYEHAIALLNAIGLGEAPRYIILPKRVPAFAAAAVAEGRKRMETVGAPELETEHWLAWRIVD